MHLHADDADFERRFVHIFSDCSLAPGAPEGANDALSARISSAAEADWATLEWQQPTAIPADPDVLPALVPELRLRPLAAGPDDREIRFCAGQPATPVAAVTPRGLRLHKSLPWQILAGHYLVHQVLGTQPELVYLHAATVAVGPSALLLCGDKGAGKSTLALTLAGRGHGFLGDEVAALHPATRVCVPFPRSVSLRPGPQGLAAAERLGAFPLQDETLGDGSTRVRAPVSRLFPGALRGETPLGAAFFLEGFGAQPRVERFAFGTAHMARLEPMSASFRGGPAGRRALELLRLFSDMPCFRLTAGGSPDATAELIEKTLEATWA